MRTNAGANINTDWAINQIVKPGHVNALTRSIKYDYVVTAQMLEGKEGSVDVDVLLAGSPSGGVIHNRTGEFHVLINAAVPNNVILQFPASSIGEGTGKLAVHVYALGPYNARVVGDPQPNASISHYFHTAGAENAVTLYGTGYNTYVGAFTLPYAIELGAHHTFTYEMSLGNIPTQPASEDAVIQRKAWLSNRVPIYSTDIIDIADITPAAIIRHPGWIYSGQQDDNAKTAVMAMLAKGIVPYVAEEFPEGIFKVYPLIRLGTINGNTSGPTDPEYLLKCAPIFRDEEGRRELRLIAGTGANEGHYVWDLVNDYPEIIDFPGANVTQSDVYTLLKDNVATKGLPRLRYTSGTQTTFIAYSYYTIYSEAYNFFWQFTSGGTTTVLYMNDVGKWFIS